MTKVNTSNLGGLKRKLDIQLSAEQVQKAFDENYKKKQKTVELPGFRKGKVPLHQIRSIYQKEIKRDTVVSLINESYRKALQQEQLKPAGDPKINFESAIVENQAFGFSAELEIQPEVDIDKDFKVQLSKPSVEVEEKEVEQALENIRAASAKFEPIREKREACWDDVVQLEITELSGSIGIEKKPMLEMKKESKLEVKGLMEGVLGMKIGEKRKTLVHLSDKYPIKEHAGKSAELELTLLGIKKKILPDLDEEFVKQFKCKDVQQLKLIIRQSIEKEKQGQSYSLMKEEALKQLVEKNPIDLLPEGVVDEQKKAIVSSVEERLKKSGMQNKEIEQYKRKYKEEFQKQACFMVQSSYLIYALANELNMSVSPQEVKIYLENSKGDQEDEEYEKMENFLIREKTIEHLISTATKT